jgi:hypothetical protein
MNPATPTAYPKIPIPTAAQVAISLSHLFWTWDQSRWSRIVGDLRLEQGLQVAPEISWRRERPSTR